MFGCDNLWGLHGARRQSYFKVDLARMLAIIYEQTCCEVAYYD